MNLRIALLAISIFISSCATNKQSRLASAGIGFGVGGVIGNTSAPKDERKEMHTVYWGSLLGLAALVVANHYFDDEPKIESLEFENEKLRIQLEVFKDGPAVLLTDKTGTSKNFPFKNNKARIKLYKIDKWADEGPNTKVHQDQLMEILPVGKGEP